MQFTAEHGHQQGRGWAGLKDKAEMGCATWCRKPDRDIGKVLGVLYKAELEHQQGASGPFRQTMRSLDNDIDQESETGASERCCA